MKRQIDIDPELEYNYNNMARRPDAPELLQRLAARSEAFRREADAALDCRYGDGERERLDLFRCGELDAPLYVYIHGGYWQRGDKSMYSYLAEPFNAAGIDVAVVGYPLCPQVSMTRLVASIRSALAWLWRNAGDLGVNPERINLSGHSAGGHLTAMALATRWPELGDDLPTDLVRTGIPLSGLYRLDPLLPTTIADALGLSAAEVSELSPVNLEPAVDAPLLVVIGGGETPGFFSQAGLLLEAWSRNECLVEKYVEPEVDHFDLLVRLGDPQSELFRRVTSWLE
ncbi:MAG TPA: alpha/beta hydrolase [Gammaproteobacteria bacterium]|nr:alpha/beta hydrolase [Gammaproteobacteria bacterium]